MLRAVPFLLFDGNCAEAMTFYHECLGGNLELTKLGDTPMKTSFPPEKHSRIIHAALINGDFQIDSTDWMASPTREPLVGNTFAVYVLGKAFDELANVFNKLAQKAKKDDSFQALHEMPFGTYGQFYDDYGTQWIFRSDPQKS
jgi:PhnB protein